MSGVANYIANQGAYDGIVATGCNPAPLLYTENVCLICVTQTYQGSQPHTHFAGIPVPISWCVEKRYQQEHPRLVSTFNEVCEVALDEPGFWISKLWLKGDIPPESATRNPLILASPDWKLAKPKMHTLHQDDPAPDSPEYSIHVLCEHGGLCPNIAHRRRISKEGAQIIQILYPSWNPPSTDVGVCALCQTSASKSQESNRGLRKQAEDEKVILNLVLCRPLTGLDTESLETHVRL